jgi:hypothetical protein
VRNNRKLRLDLQDLEVESFDAVASADAKRGTVLARADTATGLGYNCPCETRADSCYASCHGTCGNTCRGVTACSDVAETEDATCMSCYWDQGAAFYYGC